MTTSSSTPVATPHYHVWCDTCDSSEQKALREWELANLGHTYYPGPAWPTKEAAERDAAYYAVEGHTNALAECNNPHCRKSRTW